MMAMRTMLAVSKTEIRQVLEVEVALGDAARQTWNGLIPFFEEKKQAIIDAFMAESLHNDENLVKIKMQMNVLLAMESYFKERITTGTLAQMQLELDESREKQENSNG